MPKNKDHLYIRKLNESSLEIVCDDKGIIEDIYQFFKLKDPNYYPNRYSRYDGIVRLFNKKTKRLEIGLLDKLISFCDQMSLRYSMDDNLKSNNVHPKDIIDYIKTLDITNEKGEKITPYDYQYKAVFHAIKYQRATILAATSAGKSLIQYILTRMYCEMMDDEEKLLIVVPSILLVNQLAQDFIDYSTNENDWEGELLIHKIAEGAYRLSDKPIYISTWQSLQDMPQEYFHQFGYLMVDECFSGDTLVSTIDGEKRIDHIVSGDVVLTLNESTGQKQNKEVVHVHNNLSKTSMYEIETEDGEVLKVTGNHKLMTNNGWVRVDALSTQDKLLSL